MRQQVKVDKTVVKRRDQRVGQQWATCDERCGWSIDQNEIIVRLKPRHGHRQAVIEMNAIFQLWKDFGRFVIGGCRQG
jgi:hypothetical protein